MDVVNLSFFVCSHFHVRQPREMKQTVAFCLRRGKFIKMKKVLPTSHIAIGARYFIFVFSKYHQPTLEAPKLKENMLFLSPLVRSA